MDHDHSGLEILDRDECLRLLSRVPIGRIVFTHQALPAVQPVNFVFDGTDIVIKTSSASRLATAATGTIVAFEIDEIDADAQSGWSVVAVGPARHVTAAEEVRGLDRLPCGPGRPASATATSASGPNSSTGAASRRGT